MPQLIEFPPIVQDGRVTMQALATVCRATPAAGEPFRDFRTRVKDARLWRKESPLPLLRFLGTGGARIVPSPFMKRLAATSGDEPAAELISDRLWEVNPLLFKTVLDLCRERGRLRDEIYKHLASAQYRGAVPSRPDLDAWVDLAVGAEVLRPLGITVALADKAARFDARAADFDADEFLAEDKPEPEPHIPSADDAAAEAAAEPTPPSEAAPAVAQPTTDRGPRWLAGADKLPSPRNRDKVIPVARFAGTDPFSPEVLAETTRRVEAWWSEVARPSHGFVPADFGMEPEAWFDSPDEVLYRVAVAAALVFRYDADREAVLRAYRTLEDTGVLRDLYQGTMPGSLLPTIDARALMLASLVARRCAEFTELAASLDQKPNAGEVFTALEAALGRGLFRIELFWVMNMLAKLGVVRHPDVGDYTAVPYRIVRDTLFRLGFLPSPYAVDPASLAAAAKAARQMTGTAQPADEVVGSFAVAAGCAYDCPHRRSCDFACRERLE